MKNKIFIFLGGIFLGLLGQEEYEYRQDWLRSGSKAVGTVGGSLLGGALGVAGGCVCWW